MLYEKVKRDKVGNDVFAKHWGGRGGGGNYFIKCNNTSIFLYFFFLKLFTTEKTYFINYRLQKTEKEMPSTTHFIIPLVPEN